MADRTRGKRNRKAPKKREQVRVPHKELYRRLAVAIDVLHDTAVSAIGEDVDAGRRSQALVWAFGYLLGGELGHMTYLTEDHQAAELLINRAMASGIEEYAEALKSGGADAGAARTVRLLRSVARRIDGTSRRGRPHLVLVSDQPREAAPEDSGEDAARS